MRRMGLSFIVLINMGILFLSNGWQPAHEKPQPASKPQPAVDAEVLDDYIEARMRDLKIPGLALAIVRGDQIEHLRGYGVVDDAGNPVTPQTPFLVASLSKSITALAVMQLVEAGKIDLDAPVQTYLPWFQTADSEASAQITVRHLLNHTSGFSELAGYLRNLDRNVAADALETSVRALSNARLNTAPGEQYEYSNTNYDILGLLIQTVAGMPYETYIEEKIYVPLQLQNAYTSLEEARAGGLTSGYVSFFGLTRNYDRLMPYSRTVVPSAGLFASVEDMAHYLLVHLNEGRHPERAAVLSPAGIATLHTPGVVINENVKYAMGWVTFPFPQLATANGANEAVPMAISHGGAWANFRSLIVMVPDLQLGVVVLINKLDQRREEAYDLIVWNTVLLAAGLEPSMVPGSADFLVRYGQIVGVGLIALLAASFIWTVRSLSRRPPHFSRATAPAFALLLALDLAIAGYILFVEMPPTQTTLSLALAFNPEVGVLYLSILIFTLGWGTLRTLWLGINMSQQRQPLKRVS